MASLRQEIRALHAGSASIDSDALDRRLGLHPEGSEPVEPLGELLLAYGNHRIDRGDLPYGILRDLFHRLPEGSGAPLVDLGCGYGRIAFYGALLDDGFRFWGIELIRQRVAEARRVRDALELTGIEIEQGDAALVEWPDSDRYCLMNPDLPCHAPALIRRLEEAGRRRPVVIASVSSTNLLLEGEPWLDEIGPSAASRLDLRLFASRPRRSDLGGPGPRADLLSPLSRDRGCRLDRCTRKANGCLPRCTSSRRRLGVDTGAQ